MVTADRLAAIPQEVRYIAAIGFGSRGEDGGGSGASGNPGLRLWLGLAERGGLAQRGLDHDPFAVPRGSAVKRCEGVRGVHEGMMG